MAYIAAAQVGGPGKRLQAVLRLAETEDPDSFDGLAKAAVDSDSRVREAALIALGVSRATRERRSCTSARCATGTRKCGRRLSVT